MKQSHILMITLATIATMGCSHKQKVDLVVYNATVYTVDSTFSQAEAFAIDKGRFVAIGTTADIRAHYRGAEEVDAKQKPVYPGFMDGHSHLGSLGENLLRYANLGGCNSFDEVLQRLKAHYDKYKPEWLLGRGWDQNLWPDKAFPTNEELNRHFPDCYVAITRIDGHAGLVNDKLLQLMGYTADTQIDGGAVLTDQKHHMTGILLDAAYDRVKERIPKPTAAERTKGLLAAQEACFAAGLTTVSDAGLPLSTIQLIDSLHTDGTLLIRVIAMIDPDSATTSYFYAHGPLHKERLTVSSLKLYADGALGSRGANLIEPYADDPTNSGLKIYTDEYYLAQCKAAYDAGFQVSTHAIGDQGVRNMLHYYSQYLTPGNDRRWRIEHSQVVHPDDLPLYGKYNIIPSIQSTHATSDAPWAAERLGARVKNAYAYQQLLQQNGWLINGTDFPIEDISPLGTFYSAVARKSAVRLMAGNPDSEAFQPENALSRQDALRSITLWVARGAFDEQRRGSIEVGKDADFVILSDDIMTIPIDQVPTTQTEALYLAGQKVYGK